MAAEKSPAFSYYPKDLLSDDRAMAMSGEAFGCYWWLVSICWLKQYLPDDAVECAALVKSKASVRRFVAMWPEIRACFEPTDDGRLVHRRLDKERTKQAESRERRSGAARKRWDAEHKPGRALHGHSTSNADAMQCLPSPSPSPSPTAVSTGGGAHAPLDPDVAAMPWTVGTPGSARRGRQAFEWRACVPEALHAEFRRKLGGSEQEADERLRAWYRGVADDWPDLPIGESDWVFWRARFAEWVGVTAPAAPRTTAAPMPSYDPDWCQHEPRCASRDWHDLMVAREAKTEVTT